MVSRQPRVLDDAPKGTWLLASALHEEEVSADVRYPHICGIVLPAERTLTGVRDNYYRTRDCAACARQQGRTGPVTITVPGL